MSRNTTSNIVQSGSNLFQKANKYESISPEHIHGWLVDLIPIGVESVLDIGSGSGRDAFWLSHRAKNVVAVEPSRELLNFAQSKYLQSNIEWIVDSLPKLTSLRERNQVFDFIILNSVWSQIPKSKRVESFYQIMRLLKPGGYLSLSFRIDSGRNRDGIYPVSLTELKALASNYGVETIDEHQSEDQFGRADIAWVHTLFKSPQIPDAKIPLLHRIIFKDAKNGTHKLALLRAICCSYDCDEGHFNEYNEDFVIIPLGMIAFMWVKFYVPLFSKMLPQRSKNLGFETMGFANEAFKKLVLNGNIKLDLDRTLDSDQANLLHSTICNSIDWINKSPRQYIRYLNGAHLFRMRRNHVKSVIEHLKLNQEYFNSFGKFLIPFEIWQSLKIFGKFIEQDILDEWGKLIKHYAMNQGRVLSEQEIENGLNLRE